MAAILVHVGSALAVAGKVVGLRGNRVLPKAYGEPGIAYLHANHAWGEVLALQAGGLRAPVQLGPLGQLE